MRILHTGLNLVICCFNALNLYLILPMLAVIILADIFLRSVLHAPLVWAHEVSGLLLICLFFLALPSCIQKRQLLNVDIVYRVMSRQLQRYVNLFNHLLLFGFGVLLMVQGYLGVLDSLAYEARAYSINIPYWPFYAVMSIVGLICSMQSVLMVWTSFCRHKNEAGQ